MASACGGGGGGGGGDGTSASGGGVTVSTSAADRLVLEVQPIRVCDDGGIVCAQVEFFETIVNKIWDQANIEVSFLPLNQLNDSTYLTTDEDEFSDLSFSGGAGAFGRHPDSTRTQGPINLWFVDVLQTSTGLIQFGNAWIGLNGVVVSDDIIDFNNGAGRIDVIAHELGHNLGLRHTTLGAGGPDNVLSSGADREVPESIDDIYPDGDGLSRLTSAQIEKVRESDFLTQVQADELVPETVPVTSADAIPLGLIGSPAVSPATTSPPLLAARSSVPTTVPEGSPSPLTWLLLWPLVQGVYRRVHR
ncbi:zinc-dependent metalloprotease family protein [Leptothoe sp. PORK10 BA2]|uniref:zinc-dependent metalloprotease family protein n=1 Tax=Leptothoe sp. PORK10 BA2 TaxID=3110254 RepID=UPI002B1F1A98|nr:zinc-dependent metalloprotease family protein [Leptothoe sp. PORK10 BA2]MEA5464023.1 zinc-dependent metalloprotease family protein [Leptothoe sp. PORK10 BA2]